ncbi:hypothetical protein KIPE111705_14605 [Kibdelosporangium persicum]|uniref:Uncharacterized protein n=1 Tax=Kibdelosporangium persicum TaxID=2698649 RepID=A0ABX2FBH3_9PSEU|nr:hypothetical protein [Kibdelosporangium persicum]NRN68236.1 hypothetical protein [Kibdelosporangium persicum]
MGLLIGGVAFALVAVWIVTARLRTRSQTYRQGADQVARHLGRNTTSDNRETWVEIWDCHPLTIPMIREVAESMGYEYTGDSLNRRNAAKSLVFKPPKPKQRRLNL